MLAGVALSTGRGANKHWCRVRLRIGDRAVVPGGDALRGDVEAHHHREERRDPERQPNAGDYLEIARGCGQEHEDSEQGTGPERAGAHEARAGQ